METFKEFIKISWVFYKKQPSERKDSERISQKGLSKLKIWFLVINEIVIYRLGDFNFGDQHIGVFNDFAENLFAFWTPARRIERTNTIQGTLDGLKF